MLDSPHAFEQEMRRLGRPGDTTANALRQLALSRVRNVEPVLTLGHLAASVGVRLADLCSVVNRDADPYREFAVPKKGGGSRLIAAPTEDLLAVQQWLLHNVVVRRPVHASSFAYEPGRSALACARRHCGARWLISMDLQDFFHSITEPRVYKVFSEAGYAKLVSFQLARLTTRPLIGRGGGARLGRLPQGAPTSGALANRIASRMDGKLDEYATARSLVYSRYSDDLFISAGSDIRGLVPEIVATVQREALRAGFSVNVKKTRVSPPGTRRVMLGVSVAAASPRLTQNYKKRIDTHLRGVTNWGLSAHKEHRQFNSLVGFVRHVDGLLAYASQVDSHWSTPRWDHWRRLLDDAGLVEISRL